MKPIFTVIYPTSQLSRLARAEFLRAQKYMLSNELNSDADNYHILVFESELIAPIIEIHNLPDDSVDSIEKLKRRINEIIKFSTPQETLIDIKDLDINQVKQNSEA